MLNVTELIKLKCTLHFNFIDSIVIYKCTFKIYNVYSKKYKFIVYHNIQLIN